MSTAKGESYMEVDEDEQKRLADVQARARREAACGPRSSERPPCQGHRLLICMDDVVQQTIVYMGNDQEYWDMKGDPLDPCWCFWDERMKEEKRAAILQQFREVLIAMSIPARGVDIPEVNVVVQCHIPEDQ